MDRDQVCKSSTKNGVAGEDETERRPVATSRGAGFGVALFPSPFEGHLRPMFSLANFLHSLSFSITIIHTHFNAPNPKDHPADFRFIPIQDGLPEDFTCDEEDHMAFLIALNTNCNAPFSIAMASLLESSSPPVSCLIVDAQLYFTRQVAEQFGIQRIVLRTSSAASFRAFAAVPDLLVKGYLPVQDCLREEPVQDMPPLRMKDLPEFKRSKLEYVDTVLNNILVETRASSFVIMNTLDALEEIHLNKLQADLGVQVFAIGPLHKLSPYPVIDIRVKEMDIDTSCIEWLDKQPSGSVLYVSFGSLVCMNQEELMEMAWGLAYSKQRFLWVIREGLVPNIEIQTSQLLKDFQCKIHDRGKLIHWAPQQVVLRHNAIGGFWTHCGWNSILESICEGVPMICYPFFGDQFVNARFVSCVWKVGLQMEYNLERHTIKKFIQRLMVEKEGEKIKEKARSLKYDISCCLQRVESTNGSLDKFLSKITGCYIGGIGLKSSLARNKVHE